MIRTEVVGIRCELARPRGRARAVSLNCDRLAPVMPVSTSDENALLPKLRSLAEEGWTFIMMSPMRAYCPDHAGLAHACSCSGRASRQRYCPVHGTTSDLIWSKGRIPVDAAAFLDHFDAGRTPR
ncbi:hypothetical protein AB3K78_01380 [Leucobacter sp. HNU]|uniref:hypothetical protein n=1 Tax=Leucobacter sp. HNU TaxID=3236805 RepID=UPI003A80BBFF